MVRNVWEFTVLINVYKFEMYNNEIHNIIIKIMSDQSIVQNVNKYHAPTSHTSKVKKKRMDVRA